MNHNTLFSRINVCVLKVKRLAVVEIKFQNTSLSQVYCKQMLFFWNCHASGLNPAFGRTTQSIAERKAFGGSEAVLDFSWVSLPLNKLLFIRSYFFIFLLQGPNSLQLTLRGRSAPMYSFGQIQRSKSWVSVWNFVSKKVLVTKNKFANFWIRGFILDFSNLVL